MSLVSMAADDLMQRVTEIVSTHCRKFTSTMDIWSDKLGYNSCLGKNVEKQMQMVFNYIYTEGVTIHFIHTAEQRLMSVKIGNYLFCV